MLPYGVFLRSVVVRFFSCCFLHATDPKYDHPDATEPMLKFKRQLNSLILQIIINICTLHKI